MKRLFASLVLATTAYFGAATESNAQVVIYNFEFAKDGPSINYGFYDEAWVVADATGGAASWILTFRDGAQRRYISITDFGSFFFANKGNQVKGVISAAAADGTPQTTFLAIGELAQTIRIGNITVKVPKTMSGQALSADDESELPFDSREGNVGFAGITSMKGSLQYAMTNDANDDNQTVDEAIEDVITLVRRRGYSEYELDETTDGDDEATDDVTAITN